MLSSIRKLSHCVKIISLNSIQMPTNPFKNIHLFEFQIHFIALNNLCFVSITHVYYIHLYFAFCYWLCCHNQDGVLYSPKGRKLSLRPCARCAKGLLLTYPRKLTPPNLLIKLILLGLCFTA